MALLRLALVVAMVSMTLAAPVADNKSTPDMLLRLLKRLTEGSSHSIQYVNYPLQFNFNTDVSLPMAYCRIQDGEVDIVRELYAPRFEQVVGDKCLYCSGCTFDTHHMGMSCTKLRNSVCDRR